MKKNIKSNSNIVKGHFINILNQNAKAIPETFKNYLKKNESYIKRLDNLIKICSYLEKHNIRFFEEIYNISNEKVRSFLTHPDNLQDVRKHIFCITEKEMIAKNNNIFKSTKEELIEIINPNIKDLNNQSEYIKEYIQSLSDTEIESHYKGLVRGLKHAKQIADELNKAILVLQQDTYKGLATPNDFYEAAKGSSKDVKLGSFLTEDREKAIELLKNIAPESYEKIEDKDNPKEIISLIIGAKLNKRESIVFKALRAIVDNHFQLKLTPNYSSKVKTKTPDFYALCNIKPKKGGGYETHQTNKIKETLQSGSNLVKDLFYENSKEKSFFLTRFVQEIYWNKDQTITFQISDTFFANKENGLSYYYQDVKGCNRLLELMPNSEAAPALHGYLEYSLKPQKSQYQEFNLTLLLKQSGLIKAYNSKHPTRAIKDLERILDNMVKAKTLIKSWELKQGKNDAKYILENIHFKSNIVNLNNKVILPKS